MSFFYRVCHSLSLSFNDECKILWQFVWLNWEEKSFNGILPDPCNDCVLSKTFRIEKTVNSIRLQHIRFTLKRSIWLTTEVIVVVVVIFHYSWCIFVLILTSQTNTDSNECVCVLLSECLCERQNVIDKLSNSSFLTSLHVHWTLYVLSMNCWLSFTFITFTWH